MKLISYHKAIKDSKAIKVRYHDYSKVNSHDVKTAAV